MSISLIITTRNESASIDRLLESIRRQTVQPAEVIIVDAGSQDDTQSRITSFAKEHPELHLKMLINPQCTRSQGRNQAIQFAKSPVIAATDAGCELDSDWLKHITRPFENPKIQVVGGFYRLPEKISSWRSAISILAAPLPANPQDTSFLPSSRSIAFRKSAWTQVGGYPETLNTAEDLVFASKLRAAGLNQSNAPQAMVTWYPRSTFKDIIKQFYSYAYGDGQAGSSSPHARRYYTKTILLFFTLTYISYLTPNIVFVCLISLTILTLPSLIKLMQGQIPFLSLLFSPVLSIITLLGFWKGSFDKFIRLYV